MAGMISLVALALLSQIDLAPQLEKGPLVLVEEGKGGKFGQATGFVLIDAPPEKAWALVTSFDTYKAFMPKILESEVKRRTEKDVDIHVTIDVPGPDTDYVVRYTPDVAAKEVTGTWVSGDLKGSRWFWKVEAAPGGKSLVTHTLAVKNFSGIAQAVEDDSQTVTVGVNVGSVLAALKAVKRKVEADKDGVAVPGSK